MTDRTISRPRMERAIRAAGTGFTHSLGILVLLAAWELFARSGA